MARAAFVPCPYLSPSRRTTGVGNCRLPPTRRAAGGRGGASRRPPRAAGAAAAAASAADAAFIDAVTAAASTEAARMGLEVATVTWARGKLEVLIRSPDQDAEQAATDGAAGAGALDSDDGLDDEVDAGEEDEEDADEVGEDGIDDAAWETADLGDAEEIDLGVEGGDAAAAGDLGEDDDDAGGHGATLRQCQRLSGALEALLDAGTIPVPADAWTLEVGTPGAPAALTRDFEFEVFKSFPVTVRTTETWRKADRFAGTLHSRTDAAVVLNLKGRLLKIPRDIVAEVRLPTAGEEP